MIRMKTFRYILCRGVVRILGKNGVSKTDIKRVLEAVRCISAPPCDTIRHVFPLEYMIDRKKKIKKPLGIRGSRLEVRAILIIATEDC